MFYSSKIRNYRELGKHAGAILARAAQALCVRAVQPPDRR